jgi:hypothetical protein
MIRIARNTVLINIHDLMFDVIMVIGIGSKSAISTSKIMKITAIRKNRDENGIRAEFFGSNPHSNGDLFSRSSFIFFEISVVNIIMAADSKMASVAVAIVIIIIYLVFTNFLIGSQVYYLVLDKYRFIFLISRLRCIGIVKLRLQSVSIKLLLRIQSGDLMRSVMLFVVVDT